MTDERCRVMDGAEGEDSGCVRPAGHTGRHKIRDYADEVFVGSASGKRPKLGSALKARAEQFLAAPASAAEHADDEERSDRIAALCEIATAMGMARFQDGPGLGWLNPATGAAAVLNAEASELWPARISPLEDGEAATAAPCALMNILGVHGLTLPDGGILYVCGGRMIVQTPSGGLRPATLNVDPALGPAGDGS
ncbi:MAG TPA: hypothetical protein VMY35_15310 [Phycisphaerae bacterium]|nr:hypothetical protein [Phycisphaerae bacterium]